MNLTEIETKSRELYSVKDEIKLKQSELQKLEAKTQKLKEASQVLSILARVRGEKSEDEYESDELKKTQLEIKELMATRERLEKEILHGLKDLKISIPHSIPEINPENQATLCLEGETCESAISFITSLLDSEKPLKLDNVILHADKILVTNVREPIDVAKSLETFVLNMKRLARVTLRENVPEVEVLSKYLYECPYRDIWEVAKDSAKVTYQELYSRLDAKTDIDKKRIRNFFTNSKITLKNNYPFIHLRVGDYQLNFLGLLARKRYEQDYIQEKRVDIKTAEEHLSKKDNTQKQEAQNKKSREKSTLNSFLSNDRIRNTIYGKKVE